MKRFVSWAAVSTLPQAKKISLEDQLAVNRQHIDRHGGKLVEELIVPGESRDIILFEEAAHRMVAYSRLKELIDGRAFDVLIFLNHSRLGRESSLVLAVLRLCQRAGIVTYSTESPPTTLEHSKNSHSDSLLDAIKAVGAQQEIAELMRRHEIGMVGRINRGDFANHIPWPWREVYDEKGNRTIVVDDVQKRVLLTLFELYMEKGRSYRQIAADLNELGYKSPRGDDWTRSAVRSIVLMAHRYAGTIEVNRTSKVRKRVEGQMRWESIISTERAAEIRAERLRRVETRGAPPTIMRFSQVVWCEVCNAPCGGAVIVSRQYGYHYPIYRCQGPAHPGRHLMAHKVEKAIRAAINEIRSLDDLTAYAPQAQDRTGLLNDQMRQLNEQLAEQRLQLDRADDAFTSGLMTPERYQRQVDRIEKQIESLNQKITALSQTMLDEQRSGNRVSRLEEIANDGLAMMELDDIQTANAWFRKHLRVWIRASNVTFVDCI